MNFFAWFIFVCSALLEVGGDAVVRTGLRGHRWLFVLGGVVMLGLYGIVVNTVRWDFAKLLGVYVAVFAVVSVLASRFVFREMIPTSQRGRGLALSFLGGLIIQFGPH